MRCASYARASANKQRDALQTTRQVPGRSDLRKLQRPVTLHALPFGSARMRVIQLIKEKTVRV